MIECLLILWVHRFTHTYQLGLKLQLETTIIKHQLSIEIKPHLNLIFQNKGGDYIQV